MQAQVVAYYLKPLAFMISAVVMVKNHMGKRQFINYWLAGLGILLLCLGLTACTAQTAVSPIFQQPTKTLRISGSGGTTPILAALASDFTADNPTIELETLQGTGTGGGVSGIIGGVLDVAAMGRPPKPEEAEKIEFLSLGHGAEIPFVHANVTVSELNTDQLKAIFTGEITNWAAVGGEDLPIIVYMRAEDTPHTQILREAFLADIVFTDSAQIMGGMGDIIAAVEGTPGSIGYVNWPTAVAKGADVKAITINGYSATDPTYPATLEIGIGYMPDQKENVAPLLDWIQSERGQDTLRAFGVLVNH